MYCHGLNVPHSAHGAVQSSLPASRRIDAPPQESQRTRGRSRPPHALHGGKSSTFGVTGLPPETGEQRGTEERGSSHRRGILRPSCVAVSRLGFIGDYGLSHAVITGDWYGARHHPVRRMFWTKPGEDGERARAILEAV